MDDFLLSLGVRFRQLSPARRRWVLAGTILGAFLLLFFLTRMSQLSSGVFPEAPGRTGAGAEIPEVDGSRTPINNAYRPPSVAAIPPRSDAYKSVSIDFAATPGDPHIAYSAELSVVTKEFNRSRTSLEEILDRHHGYVAKLRMVGQP